jgi:ABC-2 type transport system permease protein
VIRQVRAEILKIRSTRTTIGLVLGMLVLVVAITLLSGLLQHASDLENNTENQRQLLGIGGIAGVFSALAGLLLLTSEYRFGTIRPTYLVAPSWPRILGAKIIASLVVGGVFGIVGMGISYGIGYLCLSERNIPFALDHGDEAWLLLGTIAGTAIWGAIGVGLGSIVRNQIGAVIGLLAWSFVVENILFGLVPSVGRFTIVQASNAFQGSTEDHLLAPAVGGLVMLAWMTVLAVVGWAWTSRRDVA